MCIRDRHKQPTRHSQPIQKALRQPRQHQQHQSHNRRVAEERREDGRHGPPPAVARHQRQQEGLERAGLHRSRRAQNEALEQIG